MSADSSSQSRTWCRLNRRRISLDHEVFTHEICKNKIYGKMRIGESVHVEGNFLKIRTYCTCSGYSSAVIVLLFFISLISRGFLLAQMSRTGMKESAIRHPPNEWFNISISQVIICEHHIYVPPHKTALFLQILIEINSFDQLVTKTYPRLRRFSRWLLCFNGRSGTVWNKEKRSYDRQDLSTGESSGRGMKT